MRTTEDWACRALTILVAGLGAMAFWFAGLPLPLLLGPMAACLIVALAGGELRGMGTIGIYFRTFLGVAVGSSITPQVIVELPQMAASLAFVPLFVLVIGSIGYPLFRYGFGMNHATAYYAAMPGGLQDMLVFGEEAGGDPRALSLIHATRVLVIVTVAPLVMAQYWGVNLNQPAGIPAADMALQETVLMLAAGLIGWKLAERINMFGASILGPMLLAAALSLSGVITHRPPAEMIWAAQLFIGIAVGVKYVGITARELRVDVGAGLLYSVVLALVSLVFIEAVHFLTGSPALEASLAFLPGGQAEMVVIAILAGADLAYVVSHHLLRVILVITLGPLVAKFLARKSDR